jgi:ribonuclease III
VVQTDSSELERKLGYRFKRTDLLDESLRHSSFTNEQSDPNMADNERLEFLGDAVLNLTVGHILMQHFPELKEGDLSRMRANLVNETQLAAIARKLDIGYHVRLGKGEIQTDGREKNSILANTFEAVIAAIYLDGGFDAAYDMVFEHFSALLNAMAAPNAGHDYKSRLQELVQMTTKTMPVYTLINENGPDHDKTFWIVLEVGEIRTEGVGKSKKMAEQDAARKAFEILQKH